MNAASSLIDLLGAGLSPARPDSGEPGQLGPQSLRFDQLLDRAREGSLSSGRGVTMAPGVEVDLSDDQLSRVADAADRAQAAGAKRALVRLDNRLIELDVDSRTIVGEVDTQHGDVLTGIDALVDAGATEPDAGGTSAGLAGLLEHTGINPSLLKVLARIA